MSIKAFIKRIAVQDIVYWEHAGTNEFGGAKYEDAVEIKGRWDEETAIISDSRGKEFQSDAQIISPQDLKEQSMVHLGTLASLPSDPNPRELEDAYEIKAMDRHPLFRSTTFDVFIAYLTARRS